MNIKILRSIQLFAIVLLSGVSIAQQTTTDVEGRIEQLRAEKEYLEQYRAMLQTDLQKLGTMNESGRSDYLVISKRQGSGRTWFLLTREEFQRQVAIATLTGGMSETVANARIKRAVAETKLFPALARQQIKEIDTRLAAIGREMAALQARLARNDGPTAEAAAQFTVEDNTWLGGNSVGSYVYETLLVTNLQACQDACAKAPQQRCRSYQYIKPNGIPLVYGSQPYCLLSWSVEAAGAKAPNACCTVGMKNELTVTLESNATRGLAGALPYQNQEGLTVESCRAGCAADPKCRAFNFIDTSCFSAKLRTKCGFYSEVRPSRPKKCYATGVKKP